MYCWKGWKTPFQIVSPSSGKFIHSRVVNVVVAKSDQIHDVQPFLHIGYTCWFWHILFVLADDVLTGLRECSWGRFIFDRHFRQTDRYA